MANRWGNNGNRDRLSFLGLQNHCRWWLRPWNSKMLAPWKKNYDQPWQHIFNDISRDITLPTKVCLVKAMIFPVVMYDCESWTIKKAECWRIDAFERWCCRRLLSVPWTAQKSNQSILKEISPEYSLEELMLKLKFQYFGHVMTHLKRPWYWKRLKAGGEGEDRGWDGWMASSTQWSWVWASSGSWWWTGQPGILQSMGSQRAGHNWVTELNWKGADIKSSHHKRKNL